MRQARTAVLAATVLLAAAGAALGCHGRHSSPNDTANRPGARQGQASAQQKGQASARQQAQADAEQRTQANAEQQAQADAERRAEANAEQQAQANAERRAEGRSGDRLVTIRVQARFFNDPAVKRSDVRVSARDGVVTLEGTVANEQVKRRTIKSAKSVQGVRRVDDRLAMAQPGIPAATGTVPGQTAPKGQQAAAQPRETGTGVDDHLRDGWVTVQIQSKYFADPDVKGRRIDVDSVNGIVTLTGQVGGDRARQRAEEIAAQTAGVQRVDDQLTVAATGRPAKTSGTSDAPPAGSSSTGQPAVSDDEITMRIQSKYFTDTGLRNSAIDVKTQAGVVTLSGQVGTMSQREQAVAVAAATTGVQRVDDQIEVSAPPQVGSVGRLPAPQPRGAPAGDTVAPGPVDDEQITARIQSRYFLDRTVKTSNVEVTTQNGVVTLTGTVPSDAAKRQARRLAQETDGVTGVVDRLTVDPAAGVDHPSFKL